MYKIRFALTDMMPIPKHSNNYTHTERERLKCRHTETETEKDMYINGERKGFAKNGNTVENPYKQRNDSNLVESGKKTRTLTHLYGKESGSNEKEQSREGKM